MSASMLLTSAVDAVNAVVWSPALVYLCLAAGSVYLDTLVPGIGAGFVAVSVAFFAFTTILAYYYMADTNLAFLFRNRRGRVPGAAHAVATRLVQVLLVGATFLGAVTSTETAWAMGDIGVGVMAWLNILGILALQRPALALLRDYRRQVRLGLDPVLDAGTLRSLGIRNAGFWDRRGATHHHP
ncbi:alanine:cation symporter family protein [Brevibacterium litoralis]|uniref:alanine:cation symporter family protein n=1 Tax=Brevibacterium litoralis TaxID=3138935 RepID=UPI0032F0392F